MTITLRQLECFLAVADERHFTRAADAVRMAQPSLSKQIRNLERTLGGALFSRARGHVALTPAGETLLPLARRILADSETARREVQELVGLRRGRIRLGATPSLTTVVLPDALRRLRDRYPGIEVHVSEGGSRDLVGGLAQGELDLALIIVPLQSHDPSLATSALLSERLVVAAPVDGPPGPHVQSIRVADLRDLPIVMFRDGYDLRTVAVTAFRRAGFEPRYSVEGGEMDAVLRFVEAGLGVAIVPSMVLDGRPRLRGIPFVAPGMRRTVALAHRRDVDLPRSAAAFRDTLRELLADTAAAGRLPEGVTLSRGSHRSR